MKNEQLENGDVERGIENSTKKHHACELAIPVSLLPTREGSGLLFPLCKKEAHPPCHHPFYSSLINLFQSRVLSLLQIRHVFSSSHSYRSFPSFVFGCFRRQGGFFFLSRNFFSCKTPTSSSIGSANLLIAFFSLQHLSPKIQKGGGLISSRGGRGH
jgi:hypothetical protein